MGCNHPRLTYEHLITGGVLRVLGHQPLNPRLRTPCPGIDRPTGAPAATEPITTDRQRLRAPIDPLRGCAIHLHVVNPRPSKAPSGDGRRGIALCSPTNAVHCCIGSCRQPVPHEAEQRDDTPGIEAVCNPLVYDQSIMGDQQACAAATASAVSPTW